MAKRMAGAVRRTVASLCAIVLGVLPLAGCAGAEATSDGGGSSVTFSATSGQPQGPTIAIGVSTDLPGLGYRHDGGYSGFDIDVAVYVANALGYGSRQIVFVGVQPQDRASALDEGAVDMVVSGFAMTDESVRQVTFAGPYLTVRPAALVRRHDASDDGHHRSADRSDWLDSADATVCAPKGTAVHAMIERRRTAALRDYDTYGQCMTALLAGSVDAVAADDATLPGLARYRDRAYRMLSDDDANVRLQYGIAVAQGRDELAKSIADALRTMVTDGSWQRYVQADLTPLGYGVADTIASDDIGVHSAA